MADTPESLDPANIRAAVKAGILTEAQAAELTALGRRRAEDQAARTREDEPFEFFKGFA